MTEPNREQWSVVVTLPDDPDRPDEVTNLVRRIGPYHHHHVAEHAVYNLTHMLPGAAPAGTTLAVEPYNPDLEHLDAYPPDDAVTLAEEIRAEPDGPGCGWGFPDLYARLYAVAGPERAKTKWGSACAYLDAEAESEHEEGEALRVAAERLAPHRADIDRAAKQRAAVFTEPVLLRAAEMLADMVDTATRHGVDRDALRDVTNLPGACLDATVSIVARQARNITADRARELALLVQKSLSKSFSCHIAGPYAVSLGHLPALPGARGPLAIQIIPGAGWALLFDRPGMVPSVLIDAGTTDDDAIAVADAIDRVHRGELGDPFDGRR